MNAPLTLPVRAERSSQSASRFSHLAIGAGVLLGVVLCLAVQVAAAHIQDYMRGVAWRTAAMRSAPARPVFGDGRQQAQLTKVLSGVSGEMLSSAAMRTEIGQTVETALPNVAPAAWNRLSAGGCITLTTKSGQMLSFKIVGSHLAGEPQLTGALPKIDLAVTTCTGTGEPVAKAVIEPELQQPAKSVVGQRAL